MRPGRALRCRIVRPMVSNGCWRPSGCKFFARLARLARLALTLFHSVCFRRFMRDTCCHSQPGLSQVPRSLNAVPSSEFRVVVRTRCSASRPARRSALPASWATVKSSNQVRNSRVRRIVMGRQAGSNRSRLVLTQLTAGGWNGRAVLARQAASRPVKPSQTLSNRLKLNQA